MAVGSILIFQGVMSLKLIAKAPENGWLEDDRFLLGRPRVHFQGRTVGVNGRSWEYLKSRHNREHFGAIPPQFRSAQLI